MEYTLGTKDSAQTREEILDLMIQAWTKNYMFEWCTIDKDFVKKLHGLKPCNTDSVPAEVKNDCIAAVKEIKKEWLFGWQLYHMDETISPNGEPGYCILAHLEEYAGIRKPYVICWL